MWCIVLVFVLRICRCTALNLLYFSINAIAVFQSFCQFGSTCYQTPPLFSVNIIRARFEIHVWSIWDDLMTQPYVSEVLFNSSCNNKLFSNNYYSILFPSLWHVLHVCIMSSWSICRKQSLIMSSDSDTVVAVEATEDMTMWSHDIGSSWSHELTAFLSRLRGISTT